MKKTMRFLLAAVAVVLGMTSCDEFKSFMDNPVQSYLEVRQTELHVQEGQSVMLYVHTISDAAITYTVGDEKIAKVEKVDDLDAKVTGVKPGETEVTVKLAATDAYQGGEVKVKIIVAPAVTLADAVKDGAKLKIGCKFNGEDCLLAYKFDASQKKFNQSNEDEDINVPAAFVDYSVDINYDEEMGKIAFKVNYNGEDTTMPQVPFELNLYTAGSFDRIFRVPVEMKSVVVNNYDVLPYTQESVTPVESLQAASLSDDTSVGEKGIFKVEFTPQNATNQVIKYSSDNTEVMTIDDKGVFKAIAAGVATIKAVSAENPAKFVEHKFTVTEGNTYLEWSSTQQKLVATDIPGGATVVENSNGVTWSAGTYVVEDDVEINGNITLTGNVDLIIKGDAKLTVNGNINGGINLNYNLSIYGQAQKTGQLDVSSGGDAIKNINTLEVHSAKVTATASASSCGGIYNIQKFNVYGGEVDAKFTGSGYGYGIDLKAGGSMNIHGGVVNAVGKGSNNTFSYGIRCGSSTTKANVKVYGGKLWAENADYKALNNITLTTEAGYTGEIQYGMGPSGLSSIKVGY